MTLRMLPLLFAALALPAAAGAAGSGAAGASPARPDLFLVDGHDWRLVLPATVLAAPASPKDPPAPVILFEPGKELWIGHFVERYRPKRPLLVSPSGPGAAAAAVVPTRNGGETSTRDAGELLDANSDGADRATLTGPAEALPLKLAERLVPVPDGDAAGPTVFLVASDDYPEALRGAVLAGAEHGVLLPVGPGAVSPADAVAFAAARRSELVWLGTPGKAVREAASSAQVKLRALEPAARTARTLKALEGLRDRSDVAHLVIANPDDAKGFFSPPHLSLLAPLYALTKRAPLVLTDDEPEDVEAAVAAWEDTHGPVTHVTLVGDYLALGMREILDPDQVHRKVKRPRKFKIPLLGGIHELKPSEYAVGRLAAEDAYDLSLQIGRIIHPDRTLNGSKEEVLLLSNADLKFIMGELISRTTEREMEQVGVEVASFYGNRIDHQLIRKQLPGKKVILWEGHPRDLTVDYDIGVVDQKLDARLVFLQGCYTLDRNDPYVLVQQGAAAVAGTYMAVYSASGSAFAKAFFDAMLYEGADQGEAMAHARNFLLAYVELKKRRGHDDWRKTYRAALSFDLWGDPTDRPLEPHHAPKNPPVELEKDGDTLRFRLQSEPWDRMQAGRYTVALTPGAQLGAIYTRRADWGNERRMQEVYFGWVELPDQVGPPELETELKERQYATVWSPKRKRLYVLVHNDAAEKLGRDALVFRVKPSGDAEAERAER